MEGGLESGPAARFYSPSPVVSLEALGCGGRSRVLFNFTPGISGQALAGLISLASCPGGGPLNSASLIKPTARLPLEQDLRSRGTLEHADINRQGGCEARVLM